MIVKTTGGKVVEYGRCKGMDVETKVCVITGCIVSSYLDDDTKAELINFIWELEEKAGMRE